MTDQLPRAVTLLGVVALVIALNRWAPPILPAVLVLLVLYLVTTNVDRAAALIGWLPGQLKTGYSVPNAGAR